MREDPLQGGRPPDPWAGAGRGWFCCWLYNQAVGRPRIFHPASRHRFSATAGAGLVPSCAALAPSQDVRGRREDGPHQNIDSSRTPPHQIAGRLSIEATLS